jgi:manganese/iron transport system substrate-binding protein
MLHKLPEKFGMGPRALLLTLTLSLFGCVSSPPESPMTTSPNLPKVVATTGVLCDLTQKIAQNTLNLTCLVKAGQDPHTYQPQPQDRKAIDSAQLILYGGYDHEATLLKLINSTNNASSKVAIHEKAVPQPLMGKDHEREHGENEKHPTGESISDPHVWHNR